MAKDLYESSAKAKEMLETANDILGFRITDIMFEGTADELKQTKVTQPAIFLHSVTLAAITEDFAPDMVAGHSLGEFSALVANKVLSFEDGLRLVSQRAQAMQRACEINPSTICKPYLVSRYRKCFRGNDPRPKITGNRRRRKK